MHKIGNYLTYFLLLLISNNVDASELVRIKAKKIEKKYDYIDATEDVSVSKPSGLLKANKVSIIEQDESNALKKQFDFSNAFFYSDNKFQILDKSGSLVYGNNISYDSNNNRSFITNLHLFPSDANKSILTKTAFRDGSGDLFFNDFICVFCLVKDPNILTQKKRISDEKIIQDLDSIQKPKFYPTILDNSYSKMRNLYKFAPLSFSSEEAYHNAQEERLYLKNVTLRAFGVPIFFSPRYSFSTDPNNGDSGLLFPRIRGYGLSQQGFEFPLYFRLSRNIDFTVARVQFFNMLNMPISNPYRVGESGFSAEWRHLISKQYGQDNYYTISGFITDRTALFSQDGTFQMHPNGTNVLGYRGFFIFKSDVAFSKNKFLSIDYKYYSDPNTAFFYHRDYTPYSINKIEFKHVDETQFHSVAMIEFRPISAILNPNYTVNYMPTIISRRDFQEKKFGGKFYYDFLTSYTSRSYGFNHFKSKLDVGYSITKIHQSGLRVSFDYMLKGQVHNASFISGASMVALQPQQLSLHPGATESLNAHYNRNYILGNYLGTLNALYQSVGGIAPNFAMVNSFTKLQFDYPILIQSALGETILTPIFALRYNPIFGMGRPLSILAEDSFNYKLSSSNVFSLTSNNLISMYNYGASAVYGANMRHLINDDVEISYSVAQQYRFFDPFNNHYMTSFSGLKSSLSHIVGDIFLRYKSIFVAVDYRLNSAGKLLELTSQVGLSYDKKEKLNVIAALMYTKSEAEANFYGRNLDMLGPFMRIEFFDEVYIRMFAQYALSSDPSPFFPTGKTGMTILSMGIFWKLSCAEIGVNYSRNNMTIGGIPPITVINFIFKLKVK